MIKGLYSCFTSFSLTHVASASLLVCVAFFPLLRVKQTNAVSETTRGKSYLPALNCSQTLHWSTSQPLSSGFQLSVKMATSTFHCDLNQQLAPAQSKSCSFHFFGGKHFSPTDQSEKVTNSTSMGQTLLAICFYPKFTGLAVLYHQTEKFTNLTNTILQNRSLHFSLFWQLGKSPTDKIQSFQSNLHQLLNSFTFNHQVLKSHFPKTKAKL